MSEEIATTNGGQKPSAMVPSDPGAVYAGMVPLPVPDLMTTVPYWRTSISDATPEGKARIAAALQGATIKSGDVLNLPQQITDVLYHAVQLTDKETGEIQHCIRMVLIRDDGQMIGFVSGGVVKSLQIIAYQHGPPTWNPPLPLTLREMQLGDGKRFFVINADPNYRRSTPTKGGK